MRELSRRERQRVVAMAIVRSTIVGIGLVALYALAPDRGFGQAGAIVRLLLIVVIVVCVTAWQVNKILNAPYPQVQAIESVLIAVPLLVILFALIYLGIDSSGPNEFSEPLNHTSAIYFTMTTLATVGYGDIVPKTQMARLTVTAQMAIDLILVAVIVRVFFGAATAKAGRPFGSD
jgi:voltage-gated potassium channel